MESFIGKIHLDSTPDQELINHIAEASYQRGRADGMREMWLLIKDKEKSR